jgi:type I restriction enzyme S subunit
MSEWKEYKFSDIAEVIGGGTPDTFNVSYWNGDIPWLTPKDLTGYSKIYISKGERNITSDGLKNSSAKLLPKDTVLLTTRAPIGYVAIAENEIATNQGFKNFVLKKDYADCKFVYYWLKNNIDYLRSIGTGTTFAEISGSVVKEIKILLPPLSEQKSIASILSSLDDKIDLLHRQNATLEKMAETLFRQWFVERRPEPVEGKAKEEWEEGKVSDYALHLKDSIQPQKNPSTFYFHYSISSFDNGRIPITKLGEEVQSNKYKVQKNCILFSKLNPHKEKRVWLLQDEVEENSICSTEFQVIFPKNKQHLYFLYGWLTFNENYNEIACGVGGTSGSHQRIDPKTIFEFQCPLISDSVIENFNVKIKPIFKKQVINQIQIRTLMALRDTLLPKLMSGEIRVL